MKSNFKLSILALAVSSVALASNGFAAVVHHHHHHVNHYASDYKGEAAVADTTEVRTYQTEAVVPVTGCTADRCLADGFYAGIGLGYRNTALKVNIVAPSISARYNVDGAFGNLVIGYGKYFDRFYLGGELVGNYSNTDETFASAPGITNRLRIRSGYGASIIPGMKVNDATLAYLRAGMMRSSFRLSENFNGTYESQNSWESGTQFGAGMETLVAANTSLRADYTYTTYNSFHSNNDTKIQPIDNQLSLSVVYHFDQVV